MAVVTIGRLSEECLRIINGGQIDAATNVSLAEIKLSIGQIANSLLKVEYFSVNLKMNEIIPNGTVLGLYEGVEVVSSNGKSQCTLPIKPQKLPRNMGVWAVYMRKELNGNYEYDNELIPLQMGQGGLIKSQPLLNDLLGQVGYECFGDKLVFTKDIKSLFPDVTLAMRLAIMDVSQYGDFDPLPILPEMEFQIKQEVVKMYSEEPVADNVVDSSNTENKGLPIAQQKQSL
jgi:hypothetical protein